MYNLISYHRNFITKDKENEIINFISNLSKDEKNGIYQIYRFGKYVAPYNTNIISDNIPNLFLGLNINNGFDSITINKFKKDEYIPFHLDSIDSGDVIFVLSLLGYSELHFKDKKDNTKSFIIEPLSLYEIKDEMRFDWLHSTKALEDRISIVFRKSKTK